MKLKRIDIFCSNLSSSALFYIGLLGFDVIDSSDISIELSDGIMLFEKNAYIERTGIPKSTFNNSQSITLEVEILSFDKFLYKLYQSDYHIDYTLSVIDGSRALHIYDPDRNMIIIREADDNTRRKSYEPDKVIAEDIIRVYSSNTFIFRKKDDK